MTFVPIADETTGNGLIKIRNNPRSPRKN